MLTKLKPKSEFSRNVLTLMTGTTIAQAIPIAISPILTRIYTPEDFGVFALFIGIVSILAVIITGRYELAIMLPKKDSDAYHVLILSLIINLFLSISIGVFLLLFHTYLVSIVGQVSIVNWFYFIPVAIFLTGVYQSCYLWLNRHKKYKDLALSRIALNGSMGIGNIGIGLIASGAFGLIFGWIFGQVISLLTIMKSFQINKYTNMYQITFLKLIVLAKKYIKFPKYDMVASFFNVASFQIIPVLFSFFFSTQISGFFYLTQRVLGAPVNIIATAIGDVFRERASKDYKSFGHASEIFVSTFKKLAIIGLLPSVILYFFAIDIFVIVFGSNWQVAGEYAQIMTPMLFMRFVANPLSFMFYVAEKLTLNFILQICLFMGIVLCFLFSMSSIATVISLSVVFCIFYMIQLIVSYLISKGKIN